MVKDGEEYLIGRIVMDMKHEVEVGADIFSLGLLRIRT